MIGNFRKTFLEPHFSETKIPQGVLEANSLDLPEGIHYEDVGNGFCVLHSLDKMSIRGLLSIEGIADEVFVEGMTIDDILFYARNLQKNIIIGPDKNGNIFINNEPVKATQFVKKPLENLQFVDGYFVLEPKAFTETISLPFSFNDKKENIVFARTVYDSFEEMRYESTSFEGLLIVFLINRKTGVSRVTVTVSIKKSLNVKTVKRNIEYYNYFVNGKVSIFNKIQNENNKANLVPYDDDAVCFWNELCELEKILDVTFNIESAIELADITLVKQLYKCLIEKVAFKEYISNITISGGNEFDDPDSLVGNTIAFRYQYEKDFTIFGVHLHIYAIKYLFDAKIEKCRHDENICEFALVNSDTTKMYGATKYYLNEMELNHDLMSEETMEIYRNATEIGII